MIALEHVVYCLLWFVVLCGAIKPTHHQHFTSNFKVDPPTDVAPHPRLHLLDSDLPLVKAIIPPNDWSVATKWYYGLAYQANIMLTQPPVSYVPGSMFLLVSRTVLSRVPTLAGLYRLTGNTTFADRAILEMKTVCAFPDWDPTSFLSPAEMMNAVSIGYDWLYNYLQPDERTLIEECLLKQGLHYSIEFYNGNFTHDPALPDTFEWTTANFNWNQVCNGGSLTAAIALWDVYPDLAAQVFKYAMASLPNALVEYGPDGGWMEGPMYWAYGTEYLCYVMGALESAFGTDFGLSTTFPYIGLTGNYYMATMTNGYNVFNFADCEINALRTWSAVYLGRKFNNSLYIAFERNVTLTYDGISGPITIMHLFYSRAQDDKFVFPRDFPDVPLDFYFRYTEVVTSRTAWTFIPTENYTYVAIKGGNNGFNHNHLDLGSFILEKDGVMFVTDLGGDNYGLPQYFNVTETGRYQYYRTNTTGHNTLTFNGETNQNITTAQVVKYTNSSSGIYALLDLTSAYAPNATQVTRSLTFNRLQQITTITDLILPNENTKLVTWRAHSIGNNVVASGALATLSHGVVTCNAVILSPTTATWNIVNVSLVAPYDPANITVLQIDLPVVSSSTINITVQFS